MKVWAVIQQWGEEKEGDRREVVKLFTTESRAKEEARRLDGREFGDYYYVDEWEVFE